MRGITSALVASLCLSVAATPASALRCIAPSVSESYRAAAESPEDYIIGLGYFTQTGLPVPPRGDDEDINDRQSYSVEGRFIGDLFDGQGFSLDADFAVTVEVACLGPWCGSHGNAEHALFFFRQMADGSRLLEAGLCPLWMFVDPSPDMVSEVLACHAGSCGG